MNTLQKDKEVCKHSIVLIEKERLIGWHKTIFKNNLCSDERTKNIVDSLGVDYLNKECIIAILNILETIE